VSASTVACVLNVACSNAAVDKPRSTAEVYATLSSGTQAQQPQYDVIQLDQLRHTPRHQPATSADDYVTLDTDSQRQLPQYDVIRPSI